MGGICFVCWLVQEYLSYGDRRGAAHWFFLQFIFLRHHFIVYVCVRCAQLFDYFGIVHFVFGIVVGKFILKNFLNLVCYQIFWKEELLYAALFL